MQDVLFAQGVEFPCGGRGRCKGCRIRVLSGELAVSAEDRARLSPEELAAGWRLACRARVVGGLRIELAQWEASILADESHFAFTPSDGLGIALDVGTTTLVGQLLDLRTGEVLSVVTALNAQACHGSDIMSRVDFAMHGEGGRALTGLIRQQLGRLVEDLLGAAPSRSGAVRRVVLVGNTVMHHLFCGISVEPLAHSPFEPVDDGLKVFAPADLGWDLAGEVEIRFLPCLGGFVGSDVLAGVLATGLHEVSAVGVLMDLGTNGEIVVGNREGMLCASTAAGPAFEGARISMGMRAATGAISEVHRTDGGAVRCHVLGNVAARGICGSGLVDAVACGLELGVVRPNGRLAGGTRWVLDGEVALVQQDIRELQLAKGAIAAGLDVLLRQREEDLGKVGRVHLAGAFGNYINRQSARRIGLLEVGLDRVEPAGNTALRGAKLVLFAPPGADWSFAELRGRIRHVCLHEDPVFQETYVGKMAFPGGAA